MKGSDTGLGRKNDSRENRIVILSAETSLSLLGAFRIGLYLNVVSTSSNEVSTV